MRILGISLDFLAGRNRSSTWLAVLVVGLDPRDTWLCVALAVLVVGMDPRDTWRYAAFVDSACSRNLVVVVHTSKANFVVAVCFECLYLTVRNTAEILWMMSVPVDRVVVVVVANAEILWLLFVVVDASVADTVVAHPQID